MWRTVVGVRLVALPILLFAAWPAAADILVFAAASTRNALDDVIAAYPPRQTTSVRASYAASSALARQIANGAPANLYISANARWMDWLAAKGLLADGTRRIVAANRLVLIAPKSSRLAITIRSGFDLAGELGDGRLALADPDHVPAGIYARQALVALGAWRGLAARSACTRDVRAALALVERGEAAAGIVYASDGLASRKVRIMGTFPAASHAAIVYPAALVKGRAGAEARRFHRFLRSPAAGAIFARHGFVVE